MQKQYDIWNRFISPQLLICLAIGLAGCLAIYNATFHHEQPFHFVGRQLIWLAIGITILFICSYIPPRSYDKWTYPLAGVALLSLYLLFFGGFKVNEIRGGVRIHPTVLQTLYFQLSELSKPIFVLFLAKKAISFNAFERGGFLTFIRYFMLGFIWIGPILWQSDFSSYLVYVSTFFAIFWLKGGKIFQIFIIFIIYFCLFFLEIRSEPELKGRLLEYYELITDKSVPEASILSLKTTLASGGLWGRQPDQTFWSRHYLSLGYGESIFATLGESVGFIGVVPIVVGILLWLIYCVHLARKQKDPRNALIISGISTMIAGEAYLHISATLGILPPVGMSLPLLSYGGSSLVSTMAAVGILFSLARHGERDIEIIDG